MTEDKFIRRQIPVTIVIGILFLIIGEPFMASCTAGFLGGLIALSYGVVAAIANGKFLSVLPDIVLALSSGFVFNKFIRGIKKNPVKVTYASVLFTVCKAITIVFGVRAEYNAKLAEVQTLTYETAEALDEAMQAFNQTFHEFINSAVFELVCAVLFFVVFASLKFVVIDKKLAEE